MADDLSWLTITALPGVDETTDDSLIQMRRREGPAIARRMIGLETYSRRGTPLPDKTYSRYIEADAEQGVHGHISGGSFQLLRAQDGVIHRLSGQTWTPVWNLSHVPAIAPLDASGEIQMMSAWGAVFAVDGTHNPRVIGWSYDPSDPGQTTMVPPESVIPGVDTVKYLDVENEVCEILNTRGGEGLDFIPDGMCTHLSRLVLHKGSEVRLSGAYMPCVFYDPNDSTVGNSWFFVNEDDGTDIVRMWSFEGKILMAFKPGSAHGYLGTDPSTNFNKITIDAGKGLIARRSLCEGGGRLWGCSKDGPWYYTNDEGLMDKFNAPIRTIWDSLSIVEKSQVVGWFEEGRYHISIPRMHTNLDASGTVIPDVTESRYSYDPQLKAWTHSFSVLGPSAFVKPTDANEFMLTYSQGSIWKQRDGYTLIEADPDAPTVEHNVIQDVELPWYTFGDPERYKWVRRLKIRVMAGPTSIELLYGLNYSDAWQTMTLSVPDGARKWGQGLWGEGRWIGQNEVELDIPLTLHATAFRMRLRAPGLRVKVIGIGYDYEVV